MPELIDKHAAYMALKHEAESHGLSFSVEAYDRAARIIDQMPTLEAAPVRRGRWLSYTGTHWTGKENEYGDPEYKEHIFFVCSNCRRKTVVREHFCPNCGADMREVREDVVQT